MSGPIEHPRYEDLGLISSGGMAEVRRVRDKVLGRAVAMKLIRNALLKNEIAVARFRAEAEATARLQHPGIVPVYDLGEVADGRHFFTMPEVHGRTLAETIRAAYQDRGEHGGRRLVELIGRVARAVGFAHSKGVLHRDLKPDNVMLGEHGEVLVLDWGIARRLEPSEDENEVTDRAINPDEEISEVRDWQTLAGTIAGTPAYMPPEQARGENDSLGLTADVYALGAMLYHVLCGRAPYRGADQEEIVLAVRKGPPPPVALVARERGNPVPPRAVVEVCARAMARDPADRFPDARAMADEISAWLAGARRRDQALELIALADMDREEIEALNQTVESLRSEASRMLDVLPSWSSAAEKRQGWILSDEADERERERDRLVAEMLQTLRAALLQAPDLPEAHQRIAEHYQSAHAAAEARGENEQAASLSIPLRGHGERSEEPSFFASYLEGLGALTLITDPPGADVLLLRHNLRDRRLVARDGRALGKTPLVGISLPMGSYLLILRAPGRDLVTYPVNIRRGAHWDGKAPGESAPRPIPLPPAGSLRSGERYVPAGWFLAGGDLAIHGSHPEGMRWVEGFALQRLMITNKEYIPFLEHLAAQGQEDEIERWIPRERIGDGVGRELYGRRPDGGFTLRADAAGDRWDPELPVVMIPFKATQAYCAWMRARTGIEWRLPQDLEWEKAARGVDGRIFPWGDFFEPTWCRVRGSRPGRPLPSRVGRYLVDESVYGVRDMAGNVRDWCADPWPDDSPGIEPRRLIRGGYYKSSAFDACATYRDFVPETTRFHALGFRLARAMG